jgi:hypothetical protein
MEHGFQIIIDDDRNPADALRDLAWLLENEHQVCVGGREWRKDPPLYNTLQDGLERELKCGAVGERSSPVRIVRTRLEVDHADST